MDHVDCIPQAVGWPLEWPCLALAPLVIAAALSPSNAGHGTHRQLGLPACGWQTNMGLPCPTCGMTTSFLTRGPRSVCDRRDCATRGHVAEHFVWP